MDDFLLALLGQSEWNTFRGHWMHIGFKVLVSIICGGLIGLERELKHKPAGLRTNILVCLGATLFSSLSILAAYGDNHEHVGDPARIAAQIVVGVGFLGGGMIMRAGGAVTGLTSAATAWVVSAIGTCIGIGFPITALIFTGTVYFTLSILSLVDNKVLGKSSCYDVKIHLRDMNTASRADVMSVFQNSDLDLLHLLLNDEQERYQIISRYYASEARHLRLQASLWSKEAVDRIDVKIS